ncbi:MAG: anthranilate phosphoribosyltransferase [Gammaproteobacteria bacterium]|nr:MAG: anthranilate phosphoribosyltransferase [Gammaproteobacteria bacterium]
MTNCTITDAINTIINGDHLKDEQMSSVMQIIMTGKATDAEIGGFLIGLRCKGESVDEIFAAASVMRELSSKVDIKDDNLFDTCGTGGDGSHTFNISTAVAIVSAACGIKIAKHGNRSVSSSSGSADLLELSGVNINLTPPQIKKSITETNLGFMFAPLHHSAMKYAIKARQDLKTRTIFNLLGPLTNPANATHQLLGVFDKKWCNPLIQVLQKFNIKSAMVVSSSNNMDEISLDCPTHISELKNNKIIDKIIIPEDFGIKTRTNPNIKAANCEQSLEIIKDAFSNQNTDATDIIAMNTAAVLYLSDDKNNLKDSFKIAKKAMQDGSAVNKLNQLIKFTNSF